MVTGVYKTVLEELSILNLKIDALADKVSSIIKILSRNDVSVSTNKDLESFYEHIPVLDENGLKKIEVWLEEKSNYKIMVST